MIAGIRCYFLEPVEPERTRRWLRRYSRTTRCVERSYHNGMLLLGDFDGVADEVRERPPLDDPRWPAKCDHCDYSFTPDDHSQLFTHHLFRRCDNGQLETLSEAQPGAMWFAPWFSDHPSYRGPDGRTLVVRLPPDNHDWIVDGRASNCTMKNDDVHRCWVRHGEPPNVTVDKNGNTCAAGAGSILTPNWHGFLRDGYLVE